MTFAVMVVGSIGCVAELRGSADGGADVAIVDGAAIRDGGAAGDDAGAAPDVAMSDSGTDAGTPDTGPGPGALDPPSDASSGGTGGAIPVAGDITSTDDGIEYRLIVPSSAASGPSPLLVVYSGTEGGATMTTNLRSLAGGMPWLGSAVCVVLDGVRYRGDAAAGASALAHVRGRYDIDNDRTYLLGESAGTTAALALGFSLRQSYFAAFWANDVNACDVPARSAADLGFAPWGQAGPGGDFTDARCIVDGMRAAGYRLDADSPYSGPGSGTHGDPNQFIAAVSWFGGKSRR